MLVTVLIVLCFCRTVERPYYEPATNISTPPRRVPSGSKTQQLLRPSTPGRDVWPHSAQQTTRLRLRFSKDRSNDAALVPRCSAEGFSTRPSIEALQSYSESRLAAVEDFTVIREGYGEVTWPGLTDVRGLNVDEVVKIEDKSIEVYPSSVGVVPELGVGLNKPALVTLLNCRCVRLW